MSEPDVVDEYEDLQREMEEERAEALKEGLRLIEKYGYGIPVFEEEFNDPPKMEELKTLAAKAVAMLFESDGYEATEEPVVRVDHDMFGGTRFTDEGGTERVIVARVMASIKGFKR